MHATYSTCLLVFNSQNHASYFNADEGVAFQTKYAKCVGLEYEYKIIYS